MNKYSKTIETVLNDYNYKNGSFYLKNNERKGLVLVYAHWCGYCNMLTPIWKKLAKKYNIKAIHVENKKSGNNKMSEQLNVEGYPTIFYIEKDGKIGKKYEGDRSIEDFKKVLE